MVKNPLATQRPCFDSWVGKIYWGTDSLPTPVFLGFPGGSDTKESACNAGDLGSILGLGRSPGGGHGNPLQYSCLENPYGQRSLAGYSLGAQKELGMTERLSTAQYNSLIHIISTNSLISESWIIKKAEHRRTDVFKLWCWRRLLSVPWTARV